MNEVIICCKMDLPGYADVEISLLGTREMNWSSHSFVTDFYWGRLLLNSRGYFAERGGLDQRFLCVIFAPFPHFRCPVFSFNSAKPIPDSHFCLFPNTFIRTKLRFNYRVQNPNLTPYNRRGGFTLSSGTCTLYRIWKRLSLLLICLESTPFWFS